MTRNNSEALFAIPNRAVDPYSVLTLIHERVTNQWTFQGQITCLFHNVQYTQVVVHKLQPARVGVFIYNTIINAFKFETAS
jgi:hypothetical protein